MVSGPGPLGPIVWSQGNKREIDDLVWFLDPRSGTMGEHGLLPVYDLSMALTGNVLVTAHMEILPDRTPLHAVKGYVMKPGGEFHEFWGFEDVSFARVGFSPDGQRFAAYDEQHEYWHAMEVFSNYHKILKIPLPADKPLWSPTGEALLLGGGVLWRLEEGACWFDGSLADGVTMAPSFSPAGDWLGWAATLDTGGPRHFLGYRFLHVDSCVVANPRPGDIEHPGFLVHGKDGIPLTPDEPDPAAPVWTPDGLHILGGATSAATDAATCSADAPAPLQLLAVMESAFQGEEVATPLPWSTKLAGDDCLSWQFLGFSADLGHALLSVHRYKPGSGSLTWVSREIVSVPLDGSPASSLSVVKSGLEPDDGEFHALAFSWQTGDLVVAGGPGRFARVDAETGAMQFFEALAVSPDGSSYLTAEMELRDLYGNLILAFPKPPKAMADHVASESAPYGVGIWR